MHQLFAMMLHDCMQASKGGSATENVLLPIVQIRHTWSQTASQVLSCELFTPLQDSFCRFPPDNPNIPLYWLEWRYAQHHWVSGMKLNQGMRVTANPDYRPGINNEKNPLRSEPPDFCTGFHCFQNSVLKARAGILFILKFQKFFRGILLFPEIWHKFSSVFIVF